MQHIREWRCTGSGVGILWAFVIICALLTSGCGTRGAMMSDPGDMAADQEGLFQYVPSDDCIPLSSVELAVLNSTGALDGNLSRDAMDDVTIQYKYFLHRGRPTFARFLQRAQVYLPYVKQVFRERGLPEELAYIAFIESGYNPIVVSRAGAAGTWQFMPFTGERFGLAQDWWMDERHDTFKATHAAADYLARLYGDFKDWHLAIAAYNAGEGKIGRALAGTGARSFFELVRKNDMLDERTQLRNETKQYVPRFLAVCKMMRNLEKLGFVPPDPGAATTLTRVEARPGTDLTAVAQAVGMDWAEFSSHNPAYKRHVSPIDRSSSLYVPMHARDRALACIDEARTQRAGGWKTYTVAKNDNWQGISAKNGVPVGVLKKVNDNKTLKAGVSLRIPGGGASPAAVQIAQATPAAVKKQAAAQATKAAAMPAAMPAPKEAARPGTHTTYRVKAGDTIYAIARAHGTDVDSVLRDNNMQSARELKAGQSLRISGASAVAPSATAKMQAQSPSQQTNKTGNSKASKPECNGQALLLADASGSNGKYRVQPGDTMYSIARRHNMPTLDLMRINKIDDPTTLRAGDTLRVALN